MESSSSPQISTKLNGKGMRKKTVPKDIDWIDVGRREGEGGIYSMRNPIYMSVFSINM